MTVDSPLGGPDLVAGPRDDAAAALGPTIDLVRHLTAMADRYDASAADGADERSGTVALMRATVECGRRLIEALQPGAGTPLPPVSAEADRDGRASARDEQADRRDGAAEARDVRASARDKRAAQAQEMADPGFSARFLSACDRDDAAGDRVAAQADRAEARRDRKAASAPDVQVRRRPPSVDDLLDGRELVGQAQGLLMFQRGMTAAEASEALLLAAQQQRRPLAAVAALVVHEASLSDGEASPPG